MIASLPFLICLIAAVVSWLVFRNKARDWNTGNDPFGSSKKEDSSAFGEPEYQSNTRYQDYDEAKKRRKIKDDIDRILEKVSQNGINSISASERSKLTELSKKL